MASALNESAVAAFGEVMLREVLGADFEGEVFLAGGAFRTLITEAPPRDLDLWAPGPDARSAIAARLIARGADLVGDHPPFQTVFRRGHRVIDVPYAVDSPRISDRLARFDLGLSAVGVAWRQGTVTEVVIDPCAQRSLARREVLLLRPLRNVSYLLNSLERARRYARELAFVLPESEERLLWDAYASLSRERRQKVRANYVWAGGQDEAIIASALCLGR